MRGHSAAGLAVCAPRAEAVSGELIGIRRSTGPPLGFLGSEEGRRKNVRFSNSHYLRNALVSITWPEFLVGSSGRVDREILTGQILCAGAQVSMPSAQDAHFIFHAWNQPTEGLVSQRLL